MTAYSAGLLKKGKIEGKLEGELRAYEKLSNLMRWLLKQNRMEDVNAVIDLDSDKADAARKRLFEEYKKETGEQDS